MRITQIHIFFQRRWFRGPRRGRLHGLRDPLCARARAREFVRDQPDQQRHMVRAQPADTGVKG
eukprot:4172687-Pyramimonas_sp.AAC.1